MRITLSVDALSRQLTGIGRYTWELCKRLPRDPELTSVRFYRSGLIIDDPERLLSEGRYAPIRWRPARWLARQQAKIRLRSTLVHGPNYFLPVEAQSGVITVHDLSVFRYPENHPTDRVRWFEQHFASSLARAVHIITDTEAVRRELIESFSIVEEQVTAVPLGVDPAFHPMVDDELKNALCHWDLRAGKYALSVAAFEPRKKITELVEAWRLLPRGLRDSYPLVLAGAAGWLNEQLTQQIAEAQSEGWLRHLGFVDEAHLPLLYAGARLFIYPSTYEGFGLPAVEAMASGTPVIVADGSCLREVCGDAADYVDPDDPCAFSLHLGQRLDDQSWWLKMRSRGIDQAHQYSWDRCIEGTVAIYRKAWSQIK